MLPCRITVRPSSHLLTSPRHLLLRPRQRAFHPSSSRHGGVVDLLTGNAHVLYDGMHSLGLPWACAIPASALFVRVVILGPISYWGLKLKRRRADIQPLASAATTIALRNLHSVATREERSNIPLLYGSINKWQELAIKTQRHRWKASLTYGFVPVIMQLPVFLIMAEALRQKLALGRGLLGMIIIGMGNTLHNISHAVSGKESPAWEDTMIKIKEHQMEDSFFEPSLADGGILWFPDLTVADPIHCLPLVISFLTFYNVWSGSRNAASSRLTRPLLVLALCMGPILWDAPAALLLYWIGSNVSASVVNKGLEWKWPVRIPPKACKRPLLIPRRRFNLS
ncbi:hypothetical protein BU16DRAFT_140180 [Lophium mytilinum]|uniref:Membrane insertase YidC/Oxa/ALB C-terminal domain-containing protein n=1 Tax=Lophium mytilinum TaxID=390894 RepID=A0A6A6QHP8_9PEZI|nr:hypothetical protein BU16DRAFT_140180 [Lophium mytilinum]